MYHQQMQADCSGSTRTPLQSLSLLTDTKSHKGLTTKVLERQMGWGKIDHKTRYSWAKDITHIIPCIPCSCISTLCRSTTQTFHKATSFAPTTSSWHLIGNKTPGDVSSVPCKQSWTRYKFGLIMDWSLIFFNGTFKQSYFPESNSDNLSTVYGCVGFEPTGRNGAGKRNRNTNIDIIITVIMLSLTCHCLFFESERTVCYTSK